MSWRRPAIQAAKAAGWTLLVLFLFAVAAPLVPYKWWTYVEAGWVLLTGWLSVIQRSFEEINWHWPALAMALICFGGLWLSLAFVLRVRTLTGTEARVAVSRPWRTSLALSMGLLVVFVIGTAVSGAWRHAAWLAESGRPVVVNRRHYLGTKVLAKNVDLLIRIALNEHGGKTEPALEWVTREIATEFRGRPHDLAHQVYYVAGADPRRFSLLLIDSGSVTDPPFHLLWAPESDGHQLQPEQAAAWLERHRKELRQLWPAYLPPEPPAANPPVS
ncbi:MAG TPA: hypothetical protein DCY13_17205 [Verrucomicrobiales bacterium]|nr:hypothetical protein [Verrucomicrobiales bacterium]